MHSYTICPAADEHHLQQILDLQQRNLMRNVGNSVAQTEGFVTVEHSMELLRMLHADFPSSIALADSSVVGFALAMLPARADAIPVLIPMFRNFETIVFDGKPITLWNYVVMGQICIDISARRQGLFKKLYDDLILRTSVAGYNVMVTEVAQRNSRSLQAHIHYGFDWIHTYDDDVETWCVLAKSI